MCNKGYSGNQRNFGEFMLTSRPVVGDLLSYREDGSMWRVESISESEGATIRCVQSNKECHWRVGLRFSAQPLYPENWILEDDFADWVREVREENGSDLCGV